MAIVKDLPEVCGTAYFWNTTAEARAALSMVVGNRAPAMKAGQQQGGMGRKGEGHGGTEAGQSGTQQGQLMPHDVPSESSRHASFLSLDMHRLKSYLRSEETH